MPRSPHNKNSTTVKVASCMKKQLEWVIFPNQSILWRVHELGHACLRERRLAYQQTTTSVETCLPNQLFKGGCFFTNDGKNAALHWESTNRFRASIYVMLMTFVKPHFADRNIRVKTEAYAWALKEMGIGTVFGCFAKLVTSIGGILWRSSRVSISWTQACTAISVSVVKYLVSQYRLNSPLPIDNKSLTVSSAWLPTAMALDGYFCGNKI